MRFAVRTVLALAAALVVVAPRAVHAQSPATVFHYHDADGDGVLSLLDLGPDPATGGHQIKVSLAQNGVSYLGSGITFQLDTQLPVPTLISFALVDPRGTSYQFQGKLISGITLSGQGTYNLVASPERKASWSIVLGGAVTTPSGIRGIAIEGPISPVVRPGIPNTRPLPYGIVTVQPAGGGSEIARQQADVNGRFQIALPPGTYLVVPLPPQPGAMFPRGQSQTVTVPQGQFVDLILQYDTGIR
jgi:hypothetical protein